jgi:hypothetical protein
VIELDISTRANPGSVLRIDECDRALIDGVRWTPDRRAGGLVYAHRKEPGNLKRYLHREIMRPPLGLVVDHMDRDGLNNTRANLRVVEEAINHWNRRGHGASSFKGVHGKRGKWASTINGAWLGVFDTEEAAAIAYDAAALAMGLDRTGLNFPDRDTTPCFDPVVRKTNVFGIPGLRQLSSGRFNIRVVRDGRKIGLGTFDTPDEAVAAMRAWERKLSDA